MMAKKWRVLSTGLAAAMFVSLVGCSQGSESGDSTSANDSTEQTTAADEQTEDSADAEDVAAESDTKFRVVENVTPPAPSADPLAVVFQLRQFSGEPIGSEQVKINYPAPDRAVVVSTKRGLPDDSVKATRTRYEFEPAETAADGSQLWELVQVTEQNICQAGRGPQDWSGDLCQ